MSWERFHYICRRTLNELGENESVKDRLLQIEKSPGCNAYGESDNAHSISQTILNEIKTTPDRSAAIKQLQLYGEMDFSNLITEPARYKRALIYLTFIALIFIITSGIYQILVVPTFIQIFEDFSISGLGHLSFYQTYWPYFMLAIIAMLSLALYAGFALKHLLTFSRQDFNSFALRFLVKSDIKSSYTNIMSALLFPISTEPTSPNTGDNTIQQHLKDIDTTDMDLSTEINAIIRIQSKILFSQCEKQMNFVTAFISIIVIYAIFHFVISTYSPIFMLGEII
jgi:hypothetical protein